MTLQDTITWANVKSNLRPNTFICGYCGKQTGNSVGYESSHPKICIYLCPVCCMPSLFRFSREPAHEGEVDEQVPGPLIGSTVEHVADDVANLYAEARKSVASGAYSGAVLICRKILMHVAVSKGSE